MFIVGVGGGAIDVGGNTLLIWVHRQNVGARMNALHFFFGVGTLASPIIVAQSIRISADIDWAYWLIALLLILPGVYLLRTPSPANPYTETTFEAEGIRWLLVFLITMMFFLFVGAELAYGGWIYTYALSLGQASATTAGYINSLFWGALTLGRLLSIPLPDRLRARTILFVDIVGLIFSLLLLLFASDIPSVIWIATAGMGFFMATIFPTLMILAEHHLNVTGRITSFFLVGASLGGMLIPWLIGQFFETTGPQATMLLILGTLFAAILVFGAFLWAIRPSSNGSRQP
jgi:FHS family Na+ dependent glucose MFS transporter 1